ncbi:hypothetical protein REPUB_Repub12eG0122800 [Reevesia pubescens]
MSESSVSSSTNEYVDISSYKVISSTYPVEIDYERESIFWNCNLKAPRWTSWTSANHGMRF